MNDHKRWCIAHDVDWLCVTLHKKARKPRTLHASLKTQYINHTPCRRDISPTKQTNDDAPLSLSLSMYASVLSQATTRRWCVHANPERYSRWWVYFIRSTVHARACVCVGEERHRYFFLCVVYFEGDSSTSPFIFTASFERRRSRARAVAVEREREPETNNDD